MLENEFKKLQKLLKKNVDEFEYKLILHYLESLKRIRILLSESFRAAGIDGPIKLGELNNHFAEMNKYDRLIKLERNIANEIRDLSGLTIKEINSHLVNSYGLSYSSTFEAINAGLNISIQFQKIPRAVVLEAIKNPFDRVGWDWRTEGHHMKSIDLIKSEITNGLIEGKGYLQTAANIKIKVNELTNNVARIVRTESHRVQVLGRNIALDKSIKSAKSLGIELEKVLISIIDNKTREQSRIMNGQVADKDGLFTYPNGVKGLPGNTGVSEYDINDRETVIVRIKERSK